MTPSSPLIAELERATAGSEALDVAITRWLHSYTEDVWYTQQFTRSLDAALTLVPEGPDGEKFDWLVGHTNGGMTIHAQVGPKIVVEKSNLVGAICDNVKFADTAALALCIAALKARSRRGEHG